MRLLSTLAVTLAMAITLVDGTTTTDHIVRHQLDNTPRGWSLHAIEPAADKHIKYRIAIKQSEAGLQSLEDYVLTHSANPESENFGRHMTRAEIAAMTAPPAHRVEAVTSWLAEHGITDIEHTDNSDFLHFRAPVTVGERLFNTKYKTYKHEDGHVTMRAEQYSLPAHVHDHIDFVSPTTRFPRVNEKHHIVDSQGKYSPLNKFKVQDNGKGNNGNGNGNGGNNGNGHGNGKGGVHAPKPIKYKPLNPNKLPPPPPPSSKINYTACSENTTPWCIRQYYGSEYYTPTEASKNGIGILGYIDQFFGINNLQAALRMFSVPYYGTGILNTMVTVLGNNGNPQGEQYSGGEADLDIQLSTQLAYPTPVSFYSIANDPNSDESDNDFLAMVLNNHNVPQVISTSYGGDEEGNEYIYSTRICQEYLELGAQGVSVLFSSGDWGVGHYGGGCDGPNGNIFVPQFDATCPWVTAVGGTEILPDGTEAVMQIPGLPAFSNGGGFSNYFPRPSYQDKVVSQYLKTQGNTNAGLFNPAGRAFPDVSMIGSWYPLYTSELAFGPVPPGTTLDPNPELVSVFGTSVASPALASLIALINDARIAQGKATLGFLNPAIYGSQGTGWKDIVQGDNKVCNGYGFATQAGWDPVTGFGTPIFSQLMTYFVGLGSVAPVYGDTPLPASDFTLSPSTCYYKDDCTAPPGALSTGNNGKGGGA